MAARYHGEVSLLIKTRYASRFGVPGFSKSASFRRMGLFVRSHARLCGLRRTWLRVNRCLSDILPVLLAGLGEDDFCLDGEMVGGRADGRLFDA